MARPITIAQLSAIEEFNPVVTRIVAMRIFRHMADVLHEPCEHRDGSFEGMREAMHSLTESLPHIFMAASICELLLSCTGAQSARELLDDLDTVCNKIKIYVNVMISSESMVHAMLSLEIEGVTFPYERTDAPIRPLDAISRLRDQYWSLFIGLGMTPTLSHMLALNLSLLNPACNSVLESVNRVLSTRGKRQRFVSTVSLVADLIEAYSHAYRTSCLRGAFTHGPLSAAVLTDRPGWIAPALKYLKSPELSDAAT